MSVFARCGISFGTALGRALFGSASVSWSTPTFTLAPGFGPGGLDAEQGSAGSLSGGGLYGLYVEGDLGGVGGVVG